MERMDEVVVQRPQTYAWRIRRRVIPIQLICNKRSEAYEAAIFIFPDLSGLRISDPSALPKPVHDRPMQPRGSAAVFQERRP